MEYEVIWNGGYLFCPGGVFADPEPPRRRYRPFPRRTPAGRTLLNVFKALGPLSLKQLEPYFPSTPRPVLMSRVDMLRRAGKLKVHRKDWRQRNELRVTYYELV